MVSVSSASGEHQSSGTARAAAAWIDPILPFPKLIDTYHNRGHANGLDLVYTLLGLSASGDIELQVNYDITVEALFTLVAWKRFEKRDHGVLKHAGYESVQAGRLLPT